MAPPWQGSRPGWTGLGAPWAGGRGPWPCQGGCNWMVCKVLSNPYNFMVLWFYDDTCVLIFLDISVRFVWSISWVTCQCKTPLPAKERWSFLGSNCHLCVLLICFKIAFSLQFQVFKYHEVGSKKNLLSLTGAHITACCISRLSP